METESRIAMLIQFIEEDPNDAFSRYVLALEYVKQDRDADAFALMDYLFIHHPGYIPNYYHYGKLLERLHQPDKARQVYELGLERCKAEGDGHTESEIRTAMDESE